MIAAYRISVANGWNIRTLLPFAGSHEQMKEHPKAGDDGGGESSGGGGGENLSKGKGEERTSRADTTASTTTSEAWGSVDGESSRSSVEAELVLAAKLTLVVGLLSYATKYGEPFLSSPFHPDLKVALAMVGIPTCINMAQWAAAEDDDGGDGLESPEASTSVPLL
eukprot:CAMPEP_0185260988 /NCGR_PEP_ID=MMETSP1359-20130426/9486_1 /TAXON_ID=552665 /ORGANISM="Bigelowiella longifila, Strain CCMP242" /LENGTH=165 /DNA_ID=CAMNT_0027847461 /DNA_START=401 /DNA_END=898 /DNA_ORIENTATION=+